MNRRGFLGSILVACAAPAIVRADSLMRIIPKRAVVLPAGFGTGFGKILHGVLHDGNGVLAVFDMVAAPAKDGVVTFRSAEATTHRAGVASRLVVMDSHAVELAECKLVHQQPVVAGDLIHAFAQLGDL